MIIEKTFNGAGATYKKRIKTFRDYFLKFIKQEIYLRFGSTGGGVLMYIIILLDPFLIAPFPFSLGQYLGQLK